MWHGRQPKLGRRRADGLTTARVSRSRRSTLAGHGGRNGTFAWAVASNSLVAGMDYRRPHRRGTKWGRAVGPDVGGQVYRLGIFVSGFRTASAEPEPITR